MHYFVYRNRALCAMFCMYNALFSEQICSALYIDCCVQCTDVQCILQVVMGMNSCLAEVTEEYVTQQTELEKLR